MPFPLSTLVMESIAILVDEWRTGKAGAQTTIRKIGARTIEYQKFQWAVDHPEQEQS